MRIEDTDAIGTVIKVYEGVNKKFGNFVCENCGKKVFPNKLDTFEDNAKYIHAGKTSYPLWVYEKYACKFCGNEMAIKFIPSSPGGMAIPKYDNESELKGETLPW